jgi:glycine dehydrogenase subunit 1
LRFDRPFFKEFTVRLSGDVSTRLTAALEAGYHAGLELGRWYPALTDCITTAVTEKRTREEIDGLATALKR